MDRSVVPPSTGDLVDQWVALCCCSDCTCLVFASPGATGDVALSMRARLRLTSPDGTPGPWSPYATVATLPSAELHVAEEVNGATHLDPMGVPRGGCGGACAQGERASCCAQFVAQCALSSNLQVPGERLWVSGLVYGVWGFRG